MLCLINLSNPNEAKFALSTVRSWLFNETGSGGLEILCQASYPIYECFQSLVKSVVIFPFFCLFSFPDEEAVD